MTRKKKKITYNQLKIECIICKNRKERRHMEKIKKLLEEKRKYYLEIANMASKSLEKAPQSGNLRIVHSHGAVQYYLCEDGGDTNGKYIQKKNHSLVYQLAQRDYDKKVLRSARAKVEWIERILKKTPKDDLVEIYEKSKDRKKLIHPYEISDEEYRMWWESEEYSGKEFKENTPEIYTEKGERVRSKSEKLIADKLYMMNIPYRYEYPIKLKKIGIVYPDFFILNVAKRKEFILEHFGMMDNPEYAEKAIRKIRTYEKNGIFQGEQLLLTYETSQKPIDIRGLERMLERFIL